MARQYISPDAAAIYICYDGYGQYFISRERPASHVTIVYDEDTAEKVVDLFNNDTLDVGAIHARCHDAVCNGDKRKPVGQSGCSCVARRSAMPDAAAIRAAAFEEAAKIATKHAFQARMKVRTAKGPKQRHLALAHEQAALDLAAAIRAAGEK